MSQRIKVNVPLQYAQFRLRASCQQFGKATGISYLLVKMINLCARMDDEKMDVGRMFEISAVSPDLYPVFENELRTLVYNKVITAGVLDDVKSSVVSRIRFDEERIGMFAEKGLLPAGVTDFDDDVVYLPGLTEDHRFRLGGVISTGEGVPVKFDGGTVRSAVKFMMSHPYDFDLSYGVKIYDATEDPDLRKKGTYNEPVTLEFNEGDMCFDILDNRLDTTNTKVRNPLITYLDHKSKKDDDDPDVFSLPAIGVKFRDGRKTWDSETDIKGCRYRLPCDLDLGEGLLFYGRNASVSGKSDARRLPEETPFDILQIRSKNEGFAYWLVQKNIKVRGFEDEIPVNLVAYREMSRKEISEALEPVISELGTTKGDIETLDMISRRLNSGDVLADKITESLADFNIDRLKSILSDVSKLKDDLWRAPLSASFENMLAERIRNGTEVAEVSDFYNVCGRYGLELRCDRFVPALAQKNGVLTAMDWCLEHDAGASVIGDDSAVADELRALLCSPASHETNSRKLALVTVAAEALAQLKTLTGITDPTGYRFDYTSLDDDQRKTVTTCFKDYEKGAETAREICPKFTESKDMVDLRNVFESISTAASSKRTSFSSCADENNPIVISVLLTKELRSQLAYLLNNSDPVSEQLEQLKRRGDIDQSTFQYLKEFIAFAERAVTTDVTTPADAEQKKEWVKAVASLQKLS